MAIINLPTVSVIIPAYNVQNYIEECLTSVVLQDYENLEVIVVNDGSTDRTVSIIEKFISKYAFVKLISKNNEGLPLARKSGLLMSTGSFIIHLDSDDVLLPHSISLLVAKQMEKDADVVFSDYYYWYSEVNERILYTNKFDNGYSPNNIMKSFLNFELRFNIWSKLFKREISFKGLIFEDLPMGEDVVFLSSLCVNDINFDSLSVPTVLYRQSQTQMTNNKKLNYEKIWKFVSWEESFLLKNFNLFPDICYFLSVQLYSLVCTNSYKIEFSAIQRYEKYFSISKINLPIRIKLLLWSFFYSKPIYILLSRFVAIIK